MDAAIYCWQYQVFRLRLSANRPLPGLESCAEAGVTDVRVDFLGARLDSESTFQNWTAGLSHTDPSGANLSVWTQPRADGILFRHRYQAKGGWGEFILDSEGRHVTVTWSKNASFGGVVSLLLGPVMGCILQLRGVTCLHASVVAVRDHAVALLGHPGAGKSTTAAAFARLGYAVLSDDIAALQEQESVFTVLPGDSRLRLCPSALDALYGDSANLRQVYAISDKRYLDLNPGEGMWRFRDQTLPLAALYVLDPSEPSLPAPLITPLSALEALPALLRHLYSRRIVDRAGRARQFTTLGRLVKRVPVRHLQRPADLEKLPQLCHAIAADVQDLLASTPIA